MAEYLILSWRRESATCARQADRIKSILVGSVSGWSVALDQEGCFAAVKGCCVRRVGLTAGDEAIVIGDVFRREADPGPACPTSAPDFATLGHHLTSEHWGAYVAALARPDGLLSVFRDPIGMLECISWTSDSIRLVASNPSPWLHIVPPLNIGIKWDDLGAILSNSSIGCEIVPLVGLEAVPPGTIVRFKGHRSNGLRIWRPGHYYRSGRTVAAEPARLRDVVTRCVTAWIGAYPNCAVELSGGLDSAIVAVAGAPQGRRAQYGINFFTEDLAGDERSFAREVARVSGSPVREIFMPVGALGAADLDGMPIGPRPGVGSVTLFHDRLTAEIGRAAGTTALFSGLGGDSVFFQHPTPLIAADPKFPRTSLHALHALAAWCNVSVWTAARHAWRSGSASDRPMPDDAQISLPVRVASTIHRSKWAGDLHDLPPAKQLQIAALGGCRTAFGLSWRSQAMTYIHPLLSQPIVEHVIGLDGYALTRGMRDRALAREAFADLLPRALVERPGKGSLTQFFGRCVAASVPFMRNFLLEGRLIAEGILDRAALDAMLNSEFLMRYDCYAKLISAIIVEDWARVWEERLIPLRHAELFGRPRVQATRPAS